MISPLEWHNYGLSAVNKIPDLKGFIRVKEEDHLFKQLKNFKDYPVLVFVDLSSDGGGANADAYKEVHTALVFILTEALDPKKENPETELTLDQLTHKITEDFKSLIRSRTDGAGSPCHFLRSLNLHSIHTEPVYNYHSCNGYSVSFDF